MATANIYDLADTWTAVGTTYTAIKMNVTDTASAAASLLLDLQVSGTSKFNVTKAGRVVSAYGDLSSSGLSIYPNIVMYTGSGLTGAVAGFRMGNSAAVSWSVDADYLGAPDLYLYRDAANVLAQRNSTNAQAFRIYNTYTDASNSEYFASYWASNTAYLLTIGAGTGSSRNMVIGTAGQSATLTFWTNGAERFQISGSGHLLANTDNTYDIGASGATRPRNLYIAGTATLGGVVNVAAGTATPANGSTSARLLFGTTAGFGIYYGSGAPTVSAAQGSIYLRSDGSSTTTRLYVNTDGGTTWTNFTSAA